MPLTELNQPTRTLREVHAALITSETFRVAAKKLGINKPKRLERFVRILYYKLSGTNSFDKYEYKKLVELLKEKFPHPDPEVCQKFFGKDCYDKPYLDCLTKFDIKDSTIRQLHDCLREYPKANVKDLSYLLGVTRIALETRLVQLGLKNLPISQADSHPLAGDTASAQKYYKEWYNRPISKYSYLNKPEETNRIEIAAPEKNQQQPGNELLEADLLQISPYEIPLDHLNEEIESLSFSQKEIDELLPGVVDEFLSQYPEEMATQNSPLHEPSTSVIRPRSNGHFVDPTIQEFHEALLKSPCLKSAAKKLNVYIQRVSDYLVATQRKVNTGASMSMALKWYKSTFSTEESIKLVWGNRYETSCIDTLVLTSRDTIKNRKMHVDQEIQIPLLSQEELEMLRQGTVDEPSSHQGEIATQNSLLHKPNGSVIKHWGKNNFIDNTIKEFHKALLEATTLNSVAKILKVPRWRVVRYLFLTHREAKTDVSEPITLTWYQSTFSTEESIKSVWGDRDETLCTDVITLTSSDSKKNITIGEVHQLCLAEPSMSPYLLHMCTGLSETISRNLLISVGKTIRHTDRKNGFVLSPNHPFRLSTLKAKEFFKDAYDQSVESFLKNLYERITHHEDSAQETITESEEKNISDVISEEAFNELMNNTDEFLNALDTHLPGTATTLPANDVVPTAGRRKRNLEPTGSKDPYSGHGLFESVRRPNQTPGAFNQENQTELDGLGFRPEKRKK